MLRLLTSDSRSFDFGNLPQNDPRRVAAATEVIRKYGVSDLTSILSLLALSFSHHAAPPTHCQITPPR